MVLCGLHASISWVNDGNLLLNYLRGLGVTVLGSTENPPIWFCLYINILASEIPNSAIINQNLSQQ